MDEWKPDVVHVIPHWSYDFHVAWRQARARGCRVVMSVHDDLRYTLPDKHPFRKESLRMLGEVWRDVDHVFAISQELGEEYNARYGKRSFEIITDGLASIPDDAVPMISGRLNVYFMGLFHYCYRENLRTLTRALARIKSQHPDLEINLSMRCGALEKNIDSAFPARALPFADQATVRSDMTQADLLYLPLPIGAGFEAFTRYSLSTKMVSYLGSGVPIVYHGPRDSAAAHLLIRNGAALVCDSLDDLEMIAVLDPKNGAKARSQVVENALKLARTSFPLEHLRHKFLKGIFP
jgi:glycosyltransferase involved in cell wall biosynthesis